MTQKNTKDLVLGPLPVDVINDTIGTELDAGSVVFSAAAQKHAQSRHPDDFATCFPHVAAIVAAPLYVGDDFKNEGKIELVGRVLQGKLAILVAVVIEPDAKGRYHVASAYPVSEEKIANRRAKGTLCNAVKK